MKETADKKARRQYGDYNFVRFCRNLGIDFYSTYFMMFGRLPREEYR